MSTIKPFNDSTHGSTPSSLSSKITKKLNSPFKDSALFPNIKHSKISYPELDLLDDLPRNQTTLGSDYPRAIKQNISIKKLDNQESSQAVKNAKAFYKIYVENEAQNRRMKFLQSRQKKRTAQTPDAIHRREDQYVNQLAETNLKLFKNMNKLIGADHTPQRFHNELSFPSWDDNIIVKPSIKSSPNRNKKQKFSIMDVRRESLFIPTGQSVIEENNVSNISGSNIKMNHLGASNFTLDLHKKEPRPFVNLRDILSRKQSKDQDHNSKKGNTSADFHSIKAYHNKHKNYDIFSVDSENSQISPGLPKAIPRNSNSSPDRGDYKTIDAVTQNLAIECNTKSPINKKTLTLMGKLIKTGIFKEQECDKVSQETAYAPKYKRSLIEKSRRSTSVAS